MNTGPRPFPMNVAPNTSATNESRTQEFWIDRARSVDGALAVHPKSRSERYDAWSRRMLQQWTLDRVRGLAPRYRRFVDLGCGHGDWTELFATVADEIYACDVAPAFVDQTRARVPRAAVACTDVRSYELPPRIDLAYLGAVLMYLPDGDALELLGRVHAHARPGAVVVTRDWCTLNLGRRTEQPDARYFSIHRRPADVCDLAVAAGFTCVELRSSPSIYGEVMAGRRRALAWPLRGAWRLATLHWQRASHTFVFHV